MTTTTEISTAAAALGRKGGSAKSEAKTTAVRANGALGGRPKAIPTLWTDEGLPVVRQGRGKLLLRGSSLTEGKTNKANADYIRECLDYTGPVKIGSRTY
jgi:hypothetical protein